MKILFISHRWQARTGEACKKALTKLGHDVELVWGKIGSVSTVTKYYNWLKRSRPIGSDIVRIEQNILNNILLKKAHSQRPDLIIVNAGGEIFPDTLIRLKKTTNARIVCWAGDDPSTYSHASYYLAGVKFYDHYFIGDPSWYGKAIKDSGVKRCTLLSYGADDDVYKPITLDTRDLKLYSSELSHLGVLHDRRKELLLQLMDFNLSLWGAVTTRFLARFSNVPAQLLPYIRSGIVQAAVSNKVYNASKISLNILHSQMSFYNNKTFEIAASGAFQLINIKNDAYNYFQDDELIRFNNIDELKYLISYYLSHDKERQDIASRAYAKTISNHLFIHRMKQLIDEAF